MLRRNFEVEAYAGIKQTPEEVTQERVARRLSVYDLVRCVNCVCDFIQFSKDIYEKGQNVLE